MRDYTPHKSGKDVHENRKHRSVNGYVLNRMTINNASKLNIFVWSIE
jgi:hypothetical protein